jgi:putative FmdB family regulatory protein
MPIYEYECSAHGIFEEMRPMQRSGEAADCPECNESAPRVLSATRTNLVPRAVSIAHSRNEKSQHSPHVCTSGCGHGKPKAAKRTGPQVYRGKRPWVMEHG